jgi:hypothetical protein
MEKSLTLTGDDAFYNKLVELENRKEDYFIDTGIMEAKNLPLRLLHHIGISKDDIAHLQRKTLEESVIMHDFIEPMLIRFNEMIGKYKPARDYEFTVEAGDFDTIKIHGRPKASAMANV